MKAWPMLSVLTTMVVFLGFLPAAIAAQDIGYDLTSELWAKAVLKPSVGDVVLIWKEVGTDITPSGAQVVSGYFYADPGDFAYGSTYNPEVFVKVYIDPGGWTNIAFNHVTVDDVDIYSSHNSPGSPDKTDTITLDQRLAEHQYTGVNIDTNLASSSSLQSPYYSTYGAAMSSPLSNELGYTLSSELWANAILQVINNPVTLIWKAVGADTTPSGDRVVSGYFYADPNDFAYGSIYNPEIFVKVYIASNGWANIAFNHVTVDGVSVYTAHQYTGTPSQSDSVTLDARLSEHQYTGVTISDEPGIPPIEPPDEAVACFVDQAWKLYVKWEFMSAYGFCDIQFNGNGTLTTGDCLLDSEVGTDPETGTWELLENQATGAWDLRWAWDAEPNIDFNAPVYQSGTCTDLSGTMHNSTATDSTNDGEWYLDTP